MRPRRTLRSAPAWSRSSVSSRGTTQRALSTTASNSGSADQMAAMETYIFSMIFPSLAFAGCSYLILRGANRRSLVRGKASSKSPLESPISRRRAVYYRVTVEYYCGGHHPWREIFSSEKKAQFSIGRRSVSTQYAHFSARRSAMLKGYLRRKGFMDKLKGTLEKIEPLSY